MGCKICGRSSCATSFHSLEEREKWDGIFAMDEEQLRRTVSDYIDEVASLRKEIEGLQETVDQYEDEALERDLLVD